jgi:hypothetical protein
LLVTIEGGVVQLASARPLKPYKAQDIPPPPTAKNDGSQMSNCQSTEGQKLFSVNSRENDSNIPNYCLSMWHIFLCLCGQQGMWLTGHCRSKTRSCLCFSNARHKGHTKLNGIKPGDGGEHLHLTDHGFLDHKPLRE